MRVQAGDEMELAQAHRTQVQRDLVEFVEVGDPIHRAAKRLTVGKAEHMADLVDRDAKAATETTSR